MEYDETLIQSMLDWWREVLCIQHWYVVWHAVEDTKLKNALMEIRPTSVRHHAAIFIRKSTIAKFSVKDFEKLLVHELVHLIFEPLCEEHRLELEYTDCAASKQREYKVRFTNVIEKAVEHTAQLLTRHISYLEPLTGKLPIGPLVSHNTTQDTREVLK